METKIKVTYLDYTGKAIAKIGTIYGWYNLPSFISGLGITDDKVIKIERILTASEADTEEV